MRRGNVRQIHEVNRVDEVQVFFYHIHKYLWRYLRKFYEYFSNSGTSDSTRYDIFFILGNKLRSKDFCYVIHEILILLSSSNCGSSNSNTLVESFVYMSFTQFYTNKLEISFLFRVIVVYIV